MKRAPLLALGLLAACAEAGAAGRPDGPATWHVDFAQGNDAADGTSPETAWKHAPGDPEATGRPASARLAPGDTVLFRAGVPYRGRIHLQHSGTAEKPITYTGLGWGKGMGIIDGSDPVGSVRPCRDAADCGGAAQWQELHRLDFSPPATRRIILFGQKGPYILSQLPAPPNALFVDDRMTFAPVSKAQRAQLEAGILEAPALAAAARAGGGQMELAFWVLPNVVERRPVLSVEGDSIRFPADGLSFYPNRDGAVALNGSFAGLNQPGTVVFLGPGHGVARLHEGDGAGTLSIGNGRHGIEFGGQSHVRITGLSFRNLAGSRKAAREGRALTDFSGKASHIEIRGNRIGPAALEHGGGAIHLFGTEGVRITANRIEDIAFGSGIRATGGTPRNLGIEGNVIRRIGRAGIGLLGVEGALVRGNVLAEIQGVHSNAITIYLANRDILVEGNCVIASPRPLTFHGSREPDIPNRLRIIDNIFISTPDGQAAINSWGRNMRDVEISGNVLIGPKFGLMLNQGDIDVRVTGNDTNGIETRGPIPPGWVIRDNGESLSMAAALSGQFGEEGCSVPASRMKRTTSRSPD
ncbi:right-handed parallel beta-helix repeat-containing protein [Sandaracinobacteroides sp. A072]|uniref:right-handed parallel beta-helix repeat-containing protein n=1 Tax=Sandaracinobacteroides sp. A072 TaxID=3461146 RepID=UPI0040426381